MDEVISLLLSDTIEQKLILSDESSCVADNTSSIDSNSVVDKHDGWITKRRKINEDDDGDDDDDNSDDSDDDDGEDDDGYDDDDDDSDDDDSDDDDNNNELIVDQGLAILLSAALYQALVGTTCMSGLSSPSSSSLLSTTC